jgi:hypothetical protein
LEYTLHHHVLPVNAVALNHDGDKLLSGGKLKRLIQARLDTDFLFQVMTLMWLYGIL